MAVVVEDVHTDCCTTCIGSLERVRYFPRQLLTADDMRVEQEYFRQRLRRHNLYLHGWGIACGATVEAAPSGDVHWQVRVCPGLVVSPQGDDIMIDDCVLFDLKTGQQQPDPCSVKWPCPSAGAMPGGDKRPVIYLAVRYAECSTRPVRVPPAGCGCDEIDCEYSRVRESFELKVLWKLPDSHTKAKAADEVWCQTVKKLGAVALQRQHLWPTPPCPACEKDPWVVLATIQLPKTDKDDVKAADISPIDRRVLLPTQALQVAVMCMA
jgi:hypothetical protein